jgi:citrate synthase
MTEFPTAIGTSDLHDISLLGQPIQDMMRTVGFGELAFWLAAGRRPSAGETRLFEAVLVSLADHGFTPTAIAARLTLYSAPDSIQGAIAAGLLGGGSRFLGVTEDTAKFLAATIAGLDEVPTDEAGWDAVALAAVTDARAAGKFVPGLGHPVHKEGDPRTPVIFEIAEEAGVLGPHLSLFGAIGRVHSQVLGRTLPLNGAGVGGAALADLGLPIDLIRGFALLARTAGLVGQLAEEIRTPVAPEIYHLVDRNAVYRSTP